MVGVVILVVVEVVVVLGAAVEVVVVFGAEFEVVVWVAFAVVVDIVVVV